MTTLENNKCNTWNPNQCQICSEIRGEDHNDDMIEFENIHYCHSCFTEKFQHYDCGGFKNKFAMAVYDGNYCEC
jgi:uncharacterized protein YuzB (UPF0349 family)